MAAIKAIETQYKGYRFRSRLEARWAIFFDFSGIKWYYENEGYELSSGWYLPDFWLPEYRLHVEVKPDGICKHAASFRDDEVGAIAVTQGLPDEGVEVYCWDIGDSSAGSSDRWCQWSDGPRGIKLHCNRASHRELYFDCPFSGEETSAADVYWDSSVTSRLRTAFEFAKSARFDRK